MEILKRITKINGFKRMILLAILLSVLISCENNKYEMMNNTIKARILGTTNECIGIQYQIYDTMILEDICDLKLSQLIYIKGNAVDNVVDLRLDITASDLCCIAGQTTFIYYLGGERIGSSEDKIKMFDLAERAQSETNFKWLVYDGNRVEDEKVSTVKKDEKKKSVLTLTEEEPSNDLPTLKVK